METHLLKDLAIVMAAAGGMTLICHWLRQPVVIGYLVAGLLIGPYTPPFSLISNLNSIHIMAELGLVFLLFSLGMEFSLPKIRKVGLSAGLAAFLEVIGMLGIGYLLGLAFGWSKINSIFLGSILSISSTTIIVKVFMDFKMMHEKFVQVVFGILILEDIFAIAILSILSGLGHPGGPDAATVADSFIRIGLFVILFLVLGLLLIPRFIHWVGSFKSKEVLGIVTLGLCLSGALIAHQLELSIALGAFLMGAVLAASEEIREIEEWIHPIRDMFSAIFFVSAGMLIQPKLLWDYRVPIAIVTLVTILGKVFTGAVGSFLAGYDIKTSARVGMSLAQIGEFSFVIASLGLALKVTSDFLYPMAVTVSSITTLATPYLIRNSDKVVERLMNNMPASVQSALENYGSHFHQTGATSGHGTAIFSKYLVRLGVYLAIFIAYTVLVCQISSLTGWPGDFHSPFKWALWTLGTFFCVPLFMVISKYANHILLLMVTKNKFLLHTINVHVFYNSLNFLTLILLGFVFLAAGLGFGVSPKMLVLGPMPAIASRLLRKFMARRSEWLEGKLDLVIGLATSEPTRQAVLNSSDGKFIYTTDEITVPSISLLAQQTLKESKIRERTGSTVVAIYRNGQHISNPGPDTQILADDVVILLGNEEELAKAKSFILSGE